MTDPEQWSLDDLRREPRDGKWSWVMVSLGTLAVAYGSTGLVHGGLARDLRVGSWVADVVHAVSQHCPRDELRGLEYVGRDWL